MSLLRLPILLLILIGCTPKKAPSCLPLETYLTPKVREIIKELEPYYEIKPPEASFTFNEYTYTYENYNNTNFKALYRRKGEKKELVINPDYLATNFGSPNPGIIRVSQDNHWIAYTPEDNSSIIICRIPEQKECTVVTLPFYDLQWSEDSQKIYYTVLTDGRAATLKSMDVKGENQKVIRQSQDEKEFITLEKTKMSLRDAQLSLPSSLPFDPKSAMTAAIARSLNYRLENYTSFKLIAMAQDGSEVPISIFYKSELLRKGSPILLSSYGAYGKILDLSFKPYLLYLLDHGFVLAYAHIRGGGDKGPEWHKAGRGIFKYKSYSDLKDSMKHLHESYPNSDIFLHTRSAGALAAVKSSYDDPNILNAMILDYPFLDSHSYLSNLEDALAEREMDEWGPQTPLKPASIPLTLINSSQKDNVIKLESIKAWINTMSQIPSNFIHLHLSQSGTHSGESLTYREIEEKALLIAFIEEHQNIRKQCCPYGRQ